MGHPSAERSGTTAAHGPGWVGGYFFSSDAVDGWAFLHVGVVDGKRLTFTLENEMYDCVGSAGILGQGTQGSGAGQLWVYHDANYKPAGNWTKSDLRSERDEFFTAGSDSLRWWLP